MTVPALPEWAYKVDNYPVHTEPARKGGDLVPPFTWQQLQEYFAQFMKAFIGQVAIALGGIEIAGWKPFEFLSWWGQSVVDSANNGESGSNLANLKLDGVAEILGMLTGNDFLGTLDITTIWDNIVNAFIKPLQVFLDELSPLNSNNLFNVIAANLIPTLDQLFGILTSGQIPGLDASKIISGQFADWLLGMVPVTAIGDIVSNLLSNPLFENLESVVSSVWSWDPTNSHSALGGSAKVIADGSGAKDLLSNLISVSPGQVFNVSGWVKWSSLTGTGSPMILGLTNYFQNQATSQPNLVAQAISPSTNDWKQLTATYTVPANVDAVRVRMTVAPSATSGTVWWDDMDLHKTGLMPNILVAGTQAGQTLANDLSKAFTDIANNTLALINKVAQGDFDDLLETLGAEFGSAIADVGDRLNTFLDSLSPLNGSNIASGNVLDDFLPGVRTTIDNIFNNLFNLSESGKTHTDSAHALSHVSDALAGLSSQVNQLMAAQTSGITMGDEFERAASNLGANWSVTFPQGSQGTVGTDGHNAVFNKAGNSDRTVVCRYIPLSTYSAFQVVRCTLNNRAEIPLSITGDPAYNDVLGRMSTDNKNLLRFRIGAGQAWLSQVINNVETTFNSISYGGADPGPGSTLTIVCGVGGDALFVQGRHNNNVVIEGRAPSLTGLGQGAGFGGHFNGGVLAQSAPGAVRQWTGGDQ